MLAPSSDHKHETVEIDLGSLVSVKTTAADINARVAKGDLPRIRALILNAGYSDYANLVRGADENTSMISFWYGR